MRMFSNTDEIIDSRDVEARIAELEDIILEAAEAGWVGGEQDEIDELAILNALVDDYCVSTGLDGEVLLVLDTYFIEYARQYAEDVGDLEYFPQFLYSCIDRQKLSDMLQEAFTPIEFDGVTYWARSL